MRPLLLFLMPIGLALPTAVAAGEANAAAGRSPATPAKQALLVDFPSYRVLFAKNAGVRMRPSSMTKLMTALLVFEALRARRLSGEAQVAASRHAAGQRGSRVGLKPRGGYRVRDLVRAMIVHSANDATVALAERLAGSETAFAAAMTRRARQLGLRDTAFRNATGFTAPGQLTSARDVARLAGEIVARFPARYRLFALRSVQFGGRAWPNRNPVLGRVAGADGLKTGQTRAGGYGLVASAKRGGRRLILVINGLKSAGARQREAVRLLRWGFRQPSGAGQ
ncbi:MAG: D-alanyl-D-alanine carboxypeptidase [Rhodospirillaceae bacterium]|nr:D-alanyl-D-alanine carboxypeptidase [Rhodospirillaceae bacterium]MDE0619691.1 D-alanyl-D-alanine carboxypeptidase [Rhodospirillaceae bacterium]